MDPKIAAYVESKEGRILHVYTCPAGFPSFGVGRNLKTNPLTLEEVTVLINEGVAAGAQKCLENDLARCQTEATACLGQSFSGWPPARQAAIISMLFNLGLAGFLGFRKMVQHLRDGQWELAADESLDSDRARQLPKRAAEEAKMILTGEWS